MEESNENDPFEDIEAAANRATLDLLPRKSRVQYDIAYNKFQKWCEAKGVSGKYTENVFLAYFEEKAKVWKASSLWSNYSMIKSMLRINSDVDISKYFKLIAYLKRQAEGYRPKKSKILTGVQIDQFLKSALDDEYLLMKVVVIVGIFGACRREELCQLTVDDVEDMGTSLIIKIPDTKTNVSRSFTIIEKIYLDLYRKYVALRPANVGHRRFFLKYVKGKCTRNPVGINSFGKIPAAIARFLELPNPNLYTGHCFRRSSATLLADAGANLTTIKRHGGWRSSTVAEGYIEDSLENKNLIAQKLLTVQRTLPTTSIQQQTSEDIVASTSTGNSIISTHHSSLSTENGKTAVQEINLSNCTNCTININVNK